MATPLDWELYKDNDLSSPAVPSAVLDVGLADQADADGPKDMTLMPARDFYTISDADTMPDVTCTANCNPPCSYSWFKDNDLFPDALNNTLSLGSVARGDEGNYTCRASNSLDSDTRTLRLLITYGPSSSITLTPPQTRYDIGVGSSLDVGCSAVCDPECSYRWVKDDGSTAATSGNLRISSVSSADAGVYVCRASNNVGPPASASITVNILSGPQSLTITPQSPISLEEGNDFVVTCSASCSPVCTYTWRKGSRLIVTQNGMLQLKDVTRSDAGEYTCEAKNSVNSTTGQLQVEIQCPKLIIPAITEVQSGPYTCIAQNSANNPAFSSTLIDVVYGPREDEPEIFPPEPIQSTSRGGSFQARCSADCNPDCDITWFFGSREIPSSNGILNLRSVTAEDAGVYSCRASNSVDGASQSFTLEVQAGPGTTIKFTPPGVTQEVMEGRPLSVSCSAECSPPCSFFWQTGSQNVSDSGDLTFNPIQRDDAGIYVCYASNDLDSLSSKQLEIRVMYGPEGSTRIIPDGTKNLDVGDRLNIVCVADCSPPCDYTWFLGQQRIPSFNGEVKVDAVALTDGGTYSCQANNGVGARDTKSVSVFVQSGPGGSITFNPPNDTLTLKEGNTLQVTCSAQCTPACYYVWNLGQREIPSQNGVLNIPAVSAEQKGDYTCVAANGDGNQASKVLSVDILYGPGTSLELVPDGAVQTLNEGASLQISCRSKCNPPCQHQWYFVTSPLNTTNGVLSLVSLSAENEGNYKCVASNGVGRAKEKDVLIKVQTGPGNTVRIVPDQPLYEVNEGSPLQLQCEAVCSPACTYTWYFGGTRIRATDGVFLQDAAKREDAGPYVCYAANEVAVQGSRQIQVDVLYGPTDEVMLDPSGPQRLEVGDMLTFRCSAKCKPDCQYRWFKGNSEVYSEGGRLVVGPATEASKGDYSCQAYNKVDSRTSDIISIEILKPPGNSLRFTPVDDNPSVVEGSSFEVLCEADCIPACEVSWWRGQDEIPGTYLDGTLRLQNVRRDDFHFYTCYAANGVGAPESKLLVLEVLYGPERVSVFPPEVIAPLGGSVSVSCQADCNPPCQVSWSKEMSAVPSAAGILTLTSVAAEDAGNYTCAASNEVTTGNQTVPVTIISGGGATVQFDPPDTSVVVSEGRPYSVTCQSRCAPECQVTWTRDGKPVASSAGALLQFAAVQRGDKGVYSCMARNVAGTDISQLFSLDVTYGPGASASLIPPVFTRRLSVGDSLVSRCEADCSPSCDIVWLKDGNLLPGVTGGNLLIPRVTAGDAGLYRCVADNQIGRPGVADLLVTVTFGPVNGSVSLYPPERVRPILEGESFTVTCMAECLPACTYTWYVGNFKYEANNGTLTIDQVSKRDAGTYTCHADNGVGQTRMLDLLLVVEYPPSRATLEPATSQYRVSAGLALPAVTCNADCSPQCLVSWLKDGQLLQQGGLLSLGQASREDVGSYTCTASNIHGVTETEMTVSVDYEPVITLFTVRDRKFSAVVKEGLPVKLSCQVEADPAASISFYNGSQMIYSQESTPEISYAWPRATCFDAGTYVCFADNGVGNSAESTVNLEVLCSPRLDPRIFKQPFVASQIGGTAVITVPVVADPPPSFLWYKKQGTGVEYIDPVDGKEESERFFYVNGTSSTLVIRNVQQGDFGDYIVQANITDLHPLSEYTFRVRGLNSYGYSNYSNNIVVVTQDDPEASRSVGGDVSTTPVLLGVGCALGFLVGAGITAMVVVSRCKPKPSRHNGDNTIDDYKSDTTYDTLYLKDALWAQRHIKLSNDSFKSDPHVLVNKTSHEIIYHSLGYHQFAMD
ncbi:hemicentin 2 [Elysia marginata]|uniref:Hemicentin 2 n=1 Tax=Elysia marginata TaxID=1093978 RepID=A0AAV4HPN5_9GAST|nr:hemicentin 2 [Elysia marginata]